MNTKSFSAIVFSTSLLAGMLVAPVPSSASDFFVKNQHSMTVSFSDLKVSHPTGAKTLYKRLREASLSVCGPRPDDFRWMEGMRQWNQCLEQSVASAVARIGVPAVTQVHLEHGGEIVEVPVTGSESEQVVSIEDPRY